MTAKHAGDGQPSCKLQRMMRLNLIKVSIIRHPRPACGGQLVAPAIMETTHTLTLPIYGTRHTRGMMEGSVKEDLQEGNEFRGRPH